MFLGLLGVVTGTFVFPHLMPDAKLVLGFASVLFAMPAALDVLAQQLGTYRSSPSRRFATGLLLGIAIGMAGLFSSATIGAWPLAAMREMIRQQRSGPDTDTAAGFPATGGPDDSWYKTLLPECTTTSVAVLNERQTDMDPDATNLYGRCYGREELLNTLCDAYRSAARHEPQFLVLLGMTGIGKTRLVQELYRWLTRECDPPSDGFAEGYWPDCFFNASTIDEVNPVFDQRVRPPIPFLWWGIRFRENDQYSEDVQRELKHLAAHAVQAIVHRKIRAIQTDSWWRLFNLGMSGLGLIPGVGLLANVPGWIKDGYDTWRQRGEKRQILSRQAESVVEAQRRDEAERIAQIKNTLKLFLDPHASELPTIPVVLFLDDAHWADPVTLRAVHELWTEARREKWQLLVVTTHWDDEWASHRQTPAAHGCPERLAHFLGAVEPPPQTGLRLLDIGGVPEPGLRQWTQTILPGLTDDQRELLLDKASAAAADKTGSPIPGGSPRVLGYLMSWLLEDAEDCFQDGNPAAPLTPGTAERIRSEPFDLRGIVEQRFRKLGREARKALGWSSIQGRKFLAEITAQAAEEVGRGLHRENVYEGFRLPAVHQHWIQPVSQPNTAVGRFNLCEFRSNVFYEIAKTRFTKDGDELEAVERAVRRVLQHWLRAGRLDPPTDGPPSDEGVLTIEERRDALRMAIARFRPGAAGDADDACWSTYGNALARLIKLDVSGHLWGDPLFWEQAENNAIEFARARPDGWPIALVAGGWQVAVIEVLIDVHEFALALPLLRRLLTEFGRSPQSLRDVSVSLDRLADVLLQAGQADVEIDGARKTPLALYRESLGLRQQIVTEFGRSPQSLHDLIVSYSRLAVMANGANDAETAKTHLKRCFDILREIEHLGWEDARTVRFRQGLEAIATALG